MKRIISMIMALCLMAACCPVLAEETPPQGSPYTNPNLYTAFTERPGPEENYFIYTNYDLLAEGCKDPRYWKNDDRGRAFYYLSEQGLEICRNPEYTDTESQIVQIIYNLAKDAEKCEKDSYAALAGKISRLKAVETTEELTALLQEEGFLISSPLITVNDQPSGVDMHQYVVNIGKDPVMPTLPPEEGSYEEKPDKETVCEKLIRLEYSEEEARRLVDEIARYDSEYIGEAPGWLFINEEQYTGMASLAEIRENCQPIYALVTGTGMVKEGAETERIYEIDPSGTGVFLKWYTDENLETLKAMVALRLYDDAESMLHKESIYSGYTGSEDMILFERINDVADIPMGQAYITHYCPEEKWAMATSLFEETRSAMRDRILANTWLSDESKKKAMEKLDDLIISPITPPDGSFDCGPLLESLRGCDNLLDAIALCRQFKNKCLTHYAGGKAERSNPYTSGKGVLLVGGQFLPEYNMFCIGAPALNGSFCDPTSRATLLGTLGMHIGHELSHGYDALGAMTDVSGTGTLFTEEDLAVFKQKTSSIAALLDRIETGNGFHVMGDQVTHEAMADMTGMCLMLDLAKKEENFDYDAFFRAYGAFCYLYDAGNDYQPNEHGVVDPHPPYYVRLNYSVGQFEEFYRTYPAVKEGTPMYIAPENRILVW